MNWFTHTFTFLAGGAIVALVIRANPKRAIAWLDKVVAKAKAKADRAELKARDLMNIK